jgi:hypothetical protein
VARILLLLGINDLAEKEGSTMGLDIAFIRWLELVAFVKWRDKKGPEEGYGLARNRMEDRTDDFQKVIT